MNINEIKKELPHVKVKIRGKVQWAEVKGSKLQFARVYPYHWEGKRFIRDWEGFGVSWETIERCINNERPVILD